MDEKNKYFFMGAFKNAESLTSSSRQPTFTVQSGSSSINIDGSSISSGLDIPMQNAVSISEIKSVFDPDPNLTGFNGINGFTNKVSRSSRNIEWFTNGAGTLTQKRFCNDTPIDLQSALIHTTNASSELRAVNGLRDRITENESVIVESNRELQSALMNVVRNNQELIEANQNKNRLLSILAHDLKNPFGALLTMSEFLANDLQEMERSEIAEFSEAIHFSAKTLYSFFNDLVGWAKIQNGNFTVHATQISVHALIQKMLSLLSIISDPKVVQLKNTTDASLSITTDENLLSSILNNLITNAIKFSSKGNCVSVHACERETDFLFSIKDEGLGMSPEKAQSLFTMNKVTSACGTENECGTGLGLFLTKELLTKLKGDLWVESVEKEGTTFYFTIPK